MTDRCPWCGQPARMEFVRGHYECRTCLIQDALPPVLFARNTVLQSLLQEGRPEVGIVDGYTTRVQSKLVQKGPGFTKLEICNRL